MLPGRAFLNATQGGRVYSSWSIVLLKAVSSTETGKQL